MNKRIVGAASISILAAAIITIVSVPVSASSSDARSETTQTVEIVCESPGIHIPKGTVIRGDAGSEHTLNDTKLTPGTYEVTVTATNQGSVHPNSDIIVSTGDSTVVVEDVEREAFKNAKGEGTLVVSNPNVTISVRLGKDKVFSGGVCVEFNKVVVPTPTPTPLPEPTAEPTPTPTPETGKGGTEAPVTLPATGAASMSALGVATTGLSYGAHQIVIRKRR